MQWQILNSTVIAALITYLVTEVILSMWKGAPAWLGRQVFGGVRRLWKERVYLHRLLRDERYAKWRPQTQRYVALRAVKAQMSREHRSEQLHAPMSRPLLDLLQDHLKRRESVLVLGDPGAGKTLLVRSIPSILPT